MTAYWLFGRKLDRILAEKTRDERGLLLIKLAKLWGEKCRSIGARTRPAAQIRTAG